MKIILYLKDDKAKSEYILIDKLMGHRLIYKVKGSQGIIHYFRASAMKYKNMYHWICPFFYKQ